MRNCFVCDTCKEYKTNKKFNFRRHKSKCSSKTVTIINCADCNFTTTDKKLLITHIKRNHPISHQCIHCKSYQTRHHSNFTRHKKNCKLSIKKCTHCIFFTSDKSQLIKHVKKKKSQENVSL